MTVQVSGEPILKARGLVKRYGKVTALNKVIITTISVAGMSENSFCYGA